MAAMRSLIHQVFNVGLGLMNHFVQQVSRIVCSHFGCGHQWLRASPVFADKPPAALWGRLVSCTPGANEHREDGIHCVGFETYFFPIHAVTIFAKGKYPLLRKRVVTLVLSDKQYRGIEIYLSPNRLKPFMRIEVQERWHGDRPSGLPSVLTGNAFYVKARSMIALSAFF